MSSANLPRVDPAESSLARRETAAAEKERFARLLTEFREGLDDRLDAFLERKRRRLGNRQEGAELVDGVRHLVMGGGKRIRPALVCQAFRTCGGRPQDRVLPVAMATELLHTYLLIHDDIMDRSDLRRGQKTCHVLFAELHRSRGRPGDAEHFGRSVAILLGDLAHTWAVDLFEEAASSAPHGGPLRRTFSAMCEEVILGQHLEAVLPYHDDVDEEELLEVVRLKSGRYTVERPLELGALLAGAGPERMEPLNRYARAVGEAFQLQDDILGTFGDAAQAGKPGGSDVVEGKRTLLVHFALESGTEGQARELSDILLDDDTGYASVQRARSIIRDTGALNRVRGLIVDRLDEAARAVDDGIDDEEGRAFFLGLLHYLTGREK